MTLRAVITLTPAARRWTMERGGAITLRHSTRHGCCGGRARVPVAEAGPPQNPQDYLETAIDGVHVFSPPDFVSDDDRTVTIELAGFWRWRRLVVEGIRITAGRTGRS